MIIKVILIFAILLILMFLISKRGTSRARAGVKIAAILFVLSAAVVILFPSTADDLAHAVGVGRGADLILYMLVVAFMFTTLSFYLRLKDQQQQVVRLNREVAILGAKIEKADNRKS